MNDLISVIMPAYNAERFVFYSVKSVLEQTHKNLELILIDDGSCDKTSEIINQNFGHDARLKMIKIKNSGVASALNIGFSLSCGKFIARLDSDDIAEPERLSLQIDFLIKNPNVGVVGSYARQIDENGSEYDLLKKPIHNYQLKWLTLFSNPFLHPSVMIRRPLLVQVRGYSIVKSEDSNLWSKLAHLTEYHNINKPLIKYRAHPNQVTKTNDLYGYINNLYVYRNKVDYWKRLELPILSYEIFQNIRLKRRLNRYDLDLLIHFMGNAVKKIIGNEKSLLSLLFRSAWLFFASIYLIIKINKDKNILIIIAQFISVCFFSGKVR